MKGIVFFMVSSRVWRCCQERFYSHIYMTRKAVTKKQQFWSGTNITKSSNNAFDWRNTAKGLYTDKELTHMQAHIKSRMTTEFKAPITSYSRSGPSVV